MNAAFESAGFLITGALISDAGCDAAIKHLALLGSVGARNLLQLEWCASLALRIMSHPSLAGVVPECSVPVQCTVFEKSPAPNWLVSIHQDLSIPVQEHVAHRDVKGWSHKEGVLYGQPPAAILEQLVGVRVHLDPYRPDDGSLRVVPGSHDRGILSDDEALALRDRTLCANMTETPSPVEIKVEGEAGATSDES